MKINPIKLSVLENIIPWDNQRQFKQFIDVWKMFYNSFSRFSNIILISSFIWNNIEDNDWLFNMSPFGGRYYCYDWLLLSIFSQYWSASVLILIQILLIFCVHLLGESHLVFWKLKYYLKAVAHGCLHLVLFCWVVPVWTRVALRNGTSWSRTILRTKQLECSWVRLNGDTSH